MIKTATLSLDGTYRYELSRTWYEGHGAVHFVMLNPSTADADKDDPTIRRCIGFAQRMGACKLIVTNLFAYRATIPTALCDVEDPIGPNNDTTILMGAANAAQTVLAWGSFGKFMDRGKEVRAMLSQFDCYDLGVTQLGEPRHPLYLPKDARLDKCK